MAESLSSPLTEPTPIPSAVAPEAKLFTKLRLVSFGMFLLVPSGCSQLIQNDEIYSLDDKGSVNMDSMGEQQGVSTGLNSINSDRVESGSKRLSCHLPSRPIFGGEGGL